ncbi:MAG: threonylcarbamoyl-AMP synthase [Firmicutes bacterium]|nr:threonylcarbamoyl-AMP synthase [Bacillota bacterium]
METLIFKGIDNIEEAGRIIADGGLVAFPTETVYGLGASAYDSGAAKKIYAAKGRPSDNPLIVHIDEPSRIYELADEITPDAQKIINAFMPGAVTVIVKKNAKISGDVTAGLDTVAVRCPSNEIARALIKASGVPIAAPSANISGKPSPTTARHVMDDMTGKIDAIIDGGACEVGVESTIVDTTGEVCTVLRPGGVTLEMLREVVPDIRYDKNITRAIGENEKPKCPGMKYKHYSPNADVYVIEGGEKEVQAEINRRISENKGKNIGVLFMYGAVYDGAVMLGAGGGGKEYAHNLFAALREFDRLNIDVVFAEFREADGWAQAVKNRLYKAAAYKVIHV